jgi:hypothetical protein
MNAAHPNGPRNFATLMRDAVPLPPEVVARAMKSEGCHPTLTELRAALGLDLDLTPANAAGFAAWPQGERVPSDKDLTRVLDAMYRAVTSSRLVRLEINSDGARISRFDGTIVVRGDDLTIWLFVDNTTGAEATVAANGQRISAPPHRTSSTLTSVMLPATAQATTLSMDVDGNSISIDLPLQRHAIGTLRVSLVDNASGSPTAARVYARDDAGPLWPVGATARIDFHGNAFVHAEGSFDLSVAGTAHIRAVRGIEFEPATLQLSIAPGATQAAELRCRRWSHMADSGWYSGDVHCHLHYGGEYLLQPADAALVQRAEDVHFLNMMVANQGSGWVHDEDNFSGADHALSDRGHILRWGEEYRNNFYGHMCMYGINELVPPIYSGFPNAEHHFDLPANATAAAHCHSVAGTVSYAHPMFDSIELDAVFSPQRRLSVEAKELPVDAALGHIDAYDVMSYPGNTVETCKLWYRLLNCGLRLAATAGTDTFMNFASSGTFSNPPGGDRVFVRVDGALTTDGWCAGIRAGRTFVTNGPMLTLNVASHGIGDEIAAQTGDVLHVEASVRSHVPIERIELIVDGDVVASADDPDGGAASLGHDLPIERSCWIAVRASGPTHELVLDRDGAFTHTSAVYVTVPGRPMVYRDDAAYFVDWIDRLIAVTEGYNILDSARRRP